MVLKNRLVKSVSLALLCLIGTCDAREFLTNRNTCEKCVDDGGVHCLNQELTESKCCDFKKGSQALKDCM